MKYRFCGSFSGGSRWGLRHKAPCEALKTVEPGTTPLNPHWHGSSFNPAFLTQYLCFLGAFLATMKGLCFTTLTQKLLILRRDICLVWAVWLVKSWLWWMRLSRLWKPTLPHNEKNLRSRCSVHPKVSFLTALLLEKVFFPSVTFIVTCSVCKGRG